MKLKTELLLLAGIVVFVFWFHLAFSLAPNPNAYCEERFGEGWYYREADGSAFQHCYYDGKPSNEDFFKTDFDKYCTKPDVFDLTKWRTICNFEQ